MALLKEKAYHLLSSAWHAGRLAHAYLFSAPKGAGKEWLSDQLSGLILGTSPERIHSHPDYHRVTPESKSRRIVIDQMRSLEQDIQMKPIAGRTKIAIICDADRLQPQAANAFLKTLEEPPPGCHMFLLTTLPEAILETISSRCITVLLRRSHSIKPSSTWSMITDGLAESLLQEKGPNVATAIRFTRTFQKALTEVRDRVTKDLEGDLQREIKQYRNTTDAKWEDERENQVKAQIEAAVMEERDHLLQAAEEVLAAALRYHHLPHEESSENIRQIAAASSPTLLLRRLAALERTRHLLARGVQEGLALESGFLEMIALS